MNLSSKVVINTGGSGGETRTITCYTCGMPSSQEWAQKVRSRPSSPTRSFFPFLMQMIPPHGAILREDGSTFLCAFCHASLESQWNNYEVQQVPVPPANRKYMVHKFVCGVCSVETYRKRVRALPFQEFPFLVNKRQPGSLTLGNNPLAVVCLDCSETLWAQSAEYDRWGLPIHKRHFNWMARPPPPEDSVEATVARLPSGETQLPRCPPIEPLVPSKFSLPPNVPEQVISVKQKAKSKPEANSSCRSMNRSPTTTVGISESKPGRKVSITTVSSVPVIETVSTTPSQPPVVTVAPMSSYNTLTNLRKDSMSVPPNLSSGYPKFDGMPQPCGMQAHLGPPPLYPRSALFPSPSSTYTTFPWPGRDASFGENYTYTNNTADSLKPPTSSWSWLQSPSPDLLRYQSFMSSFQNRGYGDVYLNHSQPMYGGNSPPRFAGSAGDSGPSNTPYLSPYRLHTSMSSPNPYSNTISVASSSNGPICAPPALNPSPPTFSYESSDRIASDISHPADYDTEESDLSIAGASGSNLIISQNESNTLINSNEIIYPKKNHLGKLSKVSTTPVNTDSAPSLNSSPERNFADQIQSDNDAENGNFKSAANAHGSSRTTPYSKTEERERNIVSSATMKHNSEGYVGKKWQWQSHVRNMDTKIKEAPTDDLRPIDCSRTSGNDLTRQDYSHGSAETDCAMDLSVTAPLKASQSVPPDDGGNGSSNKFMIAYLCKSETISPPFEMCDNGEEKCESRCNSVSSERDGKSGRSSVIVSAAKSDDAEDSDDPPPPRVPNDDIESVANGKQLSLSDNEKGKIEDSESDKLTNCDGTKEGTKINGDYVEAISTKLVDACNSNNDCQVNNVSALLNFSTTSLGGLNVESNLTVSDNTNSKQETANFLKDTLEEFIQKKKKTEKDLAKKEREQSKFLAELGLITPEQKNEIELNSLISRCEHKTLPPLKRRAGTPPKVKLRQEFERQLLQVAFDDPSLKQNVTDPTKASFMEVLGLKTASMNDKNRRESEWRLVLTERIMRETRCSRLRGYKRPWDTFSNVENLLTPITKSSKSDSNPTVLQSLSLTLPPDSVENTCTNCHTGSSDLLTTVESRETSQTDTEIDRTVESAASVVIKNGMSIVYPKYIPSYAVSSSHTVKSDKNTKYVPPHETTASILNVPIYSGNFPSIANSTESSSLAVTQEDSSDIVIPSNNQALVVYRENILKVPVINPGSLRTISRRNSIASCPTDDTDDLTSSGDEIEEILSNVTKNQTSSSVNVNDDISAKVESINRCCTENWRQTRECIEAFVTSSPGEGIANKIQLARSADNLKTLRKYLKSQQDEMKTTEKMLKLKEKQLVKQLRALNKNTLKHNSRSKITDKEV